MSTNNTERQRLKPFGSTHCGDRHVIHTHTHITCLASSYIYGNSMRMWEYVLQDWEREPRGTYYLITWWALLWVTISERKTTKGDCTSSSSRGHPQTLIIAKIENVHRWQPTRKHVALPKRQRHPSAAIRPPSAAFNWPPILYIVLHDDFDERGIWVNEKLFICRLLETKYVLCSECAENWQFGLFWIQSILDVNECT